MGRGKIGALSAEMALGVLGNIRRAEVAPEVSSFGLADPADDSGVCAEGNGSFPCTIRMG